MHEYSAPEGSGSFRASGRFRNKANWLSGYVFIPVAVGFVFFVDPTALFHPRTALIVSFYGRLIVSIVPLVLALFGYFHFARPFVEIGSSGDESMLRIQNPLSRWMIPMSAAKAVAYRGLSDRPSIVLKDGRRIKLYALEQSNLMLARGLDLGEPLRELRAAGESSPRPPGAHRTVDLIDPVVLGIVAAWIVYIGISVLRWW